MSCILKVDRRLKADILHFPSACANRLAPTSSRFRTIPCRPNGYYHQLPCGYFVSWELIGETEDILHLIASGACRNLKIRILGAGASSPK